MGQEILCVITLLLYSTVNLNICYWGSHTIWNIGFLFWIFCSLFGGKGTPSTTLGLVVYRFVCLVSLLITNLSLLLLLLLILWCLHLYWLSWNGRRYSSLLLCRLLLSNRLLRLLLRFCTRFLKLTYFSVDIFMRIKHAALKYTIDLI